MMRDVIERFRYRFDLWQREQREDWIGPPGTHLPQFVDYSRGSPKLEALRKSESIPKFFIKSIGLYLCIIIIIAQICRLLGLLIPVARFVAFVLFVILVSVCTVIAVIGTIGEYKVRKARQREITESSN